MFVRIFKNKKFVSKVIEYYSIIILIFFGRDNICRTIATMKTEKKLYSVILLILESKDKSILCKKKKKRSE